MSVTLPNVDLSSYAVGQTGKIDLSTISGGGGVPFQSDDKATLRLHNDSGSGLRITLPKSSQQFNLPAGGWVDCYPSPGESQVQFLVLSLLPNPPITLLMSTYFFPGEDVPPMTILGNSPVGIGGTINTNVSSTQSIVNTTNAPGSNWLNVQPTDAAAATFSGDTSGNLTVNSDEAGTLTTLLQLIAGASPTVKIAAASVLTRALGDFAVNGFLYGNVGLLTFGETANHFNGTVEIAGATKVDSTFESVGAATFDSTLTVTGASSLDNGSTASDGTGNWTFANNKFLSWKDSTGGVHSVIGFTSGNDPVIRTASNNARLLVEDGSGNVIAAFSNNQNGTDTIAEGAIECQKVFFNTGSIKDLNNGSNLSGTINHGLTGTPAAVLATCNSSSSSATVGASNYTSTQFTLTIGGGLNGRWLAYR